MTHKPRSPSLAARPDPPQASDASARPPVDPSDLSLQQAMRKDRFRLRRARERLPADEYLKRLKQSIDVCDARKAATPEIRYPSELPITGHRDELLRLIDQRQVIVVCGETGSGKSTQLPKLCLEAGLGREAMIGHTQPRRLAARSIAARLAQELGTPLGKSVGYQVRFGDQTSDETLIKLMTDGILLAETQSDRFLDAYDAIIIDEAHERSLNIDFLMGYLRQLQGKRPDLKIIITSATIDAERFAGHFADEQGPAPVLNVEGRGYPVTIDYLPWEDVVDDESRSYDLSRHVIAGVDSVGAKEPGDTLVFLPTERDIREVSHRVGGHYRRRGMEGRVEVLPLYARLPEKEQQRIFQPSGAKRRIIFATNVAESSLTVPGIRCVVDTGNARVSRYSPRSKVQRLPIESVSRASADQRAGRCGRVGPGVCVRLYSEEDYNGREDYTTPEIRRTNLASVILQTKVLRLGRLEEFPLLDPPRPEAIREGIRTLQELGAIDDKHELTDIGWKLGRMPVDPRVGRILLAAEDQGVLAEILPIAAALELPDPRDRPPDKQQAADDAHARFVDPRSDFLSYLRLWRYYGEARKELSRHRLTRELRKQFLSPNRMREWGDVYRQLKEMASTSLGGGTKKSKRRSIGEIRYADGDDTIVDDPTYAAIHQSLLAGLLSGVAMAGEKNEYTGGGGLKLYLWPGSGVFSKKPKWIVAAELVETAKQYARTVAQVQPQWIESVGAHLIKRSHSDAHWSEKSGGSFCYQRQSLFGLPVVVRRRVPLPPVDPATARDLLIEQGLAEHQLSTGAKFVRHNQSLQAAIAALAAKTRRRDLVIDSYIVARFYHSRLPDDICDRGRLEKLDRSTKQPRWTESLRSAEDVSRWLHSPPEIADESASLYMRPGDLVDSIGEASEPVLPSDELEMFPDELAVGNSRLPLDYRYEPGGDRDGINLRVHQAALAQLSDDRLGWLVPGMLQPKVVAMIKSLPKRLRRNLVPAADVAQKIVQELKPRFGQVPFMPAVCESMTRQAGVSITPSDFQAEKQDAHFQFLVTVIDDEGTPIAEGRQVDPLKSSVATTENHSAGPTSDESDESWSRGSMKTFDIESLPREVIRNRGGVQVAQYVGLVDLGDSAATRLFADAASAESSIGVGMTRLYAITERKELRNQVRWLPSLEQAKVKLSGVVPTGKIEGALCDLLAKIAFVEGQPVIRTAEEFEKRRSERGRRIAEATQDVAGWLSGFADAYFSVRRALESTTQARQNETLGDIRQQIEWLFPDEFLTITSWDWLQHYPRYFAAIAYRLDKVTAGAATRDAESTDVIRSLWHRWIESLSESEQNPVSQVDSEFRWMIEELRVSLFAQSLGTSVKVSPKRCEKLLI